VVEAFWRGLTAHQIEKETIEDVEAGGMAFPRGIGEPIWPWCRFSCSS
jgi:hypothetical protein